MKLRTEHEQRSRAGGKKSLRCFHIQITEWFGRRNFKINCFAGRWPPLQSPINLNQEYSVTGKKITLLNKRKQFCLFMNCSFKRNVPYILITTFIISAMYKICMSLLTRMFSLSLLLRRFPFKENITCNDGSSPFKI